MNYFFLVKDIRNIFLYKMPIIKKLTNEYLELYKEYLEFLTLNEIKEKDVLQVYFIYSNRYYNKNCLLYNSNLTMEECSMYNLTVDDDSNCIITNNFSAKIYVKLMDGTIISFRCTQEPMKSRNERSLIQKIVNKNNLSSTHYKLLQEEHFL
jgi:hypothetical protein